MKANMKNMKRQTTGQKKIFANQVSNKGQASSLYKALLKFNSKKQTVQLENEQKMRHLTEEDIQIKTKSLKVCPSSLTLQKFILTPK